MPVLLSNIYCVPKWTTTNDKVNLPLETHSKCYRGLFMVFIHANVFKRLRYIYLSCPSTPTIGSKMRQNTNVQWESEACSMPGQQSQKDSLGWEQDLPESQGLALARDHVCVTGQQIHKLGESIGTESKRKRAKSRCCYGSSPLLAVLFLRSQWPVINHSTTILNGKSRNTKCFK